MSELLKQVESLAPWHMKVDLGNGLFTSGKSDPKSVTGVLERVYPQGLEGRSFLDAGCNCGATCFAVKKMGAGKVLGVDVRPHWMKQAEFLKTQLPSDDIEFKLCHANEVDVEPFDIVAFKGLFYHLSDPIGAMKRLDANELIIVDTDGDPSVPEDCIQAGMEKTSGDLMGVDGLKWLPGGPKVMQMILESLGYKYTAIEYNRPLSPRRTEKCHKKELIRFCVVGSKKEGMLDKIGKRK